MNKTAEEYLNFVENVNAEYHKISGDEERVPLVLTSSGDFNTIELNLEDCLCSSEDENIEEGIESIDTFIKKLKSFKRAVVKVYSKLSDEQLEYFGVYKDEE